MAGQPAMNASSLNRVRAMPLDLWFDNLAMRLDGSKAEGLLLRIHWLFTDTGEQVLRQLMGLIDSFERMFPVV